MWRTKKFLPKKSRRTRVFAKTKSKKKFTVKKKFCRKKMCTKFFFAKTKIFVKVKTLPKKIFLKKNAQKKHLNKTNNFAEKKSFAKTYFWSNYQGKLFLLKFWLLWFSSPIQLSWEEIQLSQNLRSWELACRFNSQKKDNPKDLGLGWNLLNII